MFDSVFLLLGALSSVFTFIVELFYFSIFKNNLDRGLRLFLGFGLLYLGIIYFITFLGFLKVCQDDLSYSVYLRPVIFMIILIPGIITVLDLKRHGVSFKQIVKEIKHKWNFLR